VQNPPTAQNWLIGSTGPIRQGSMYVGPRPAPGVTESHGTRVQPRSLYYAQLGQRLAGSLPTPWTQLYPEADAYVRDGSYADRNFGRETTLAAKNDLANYRSESYVRFNLAGMAGRRVLAANVRLVVGTVGAPVETAVAYVSNNSWSETDITWNNKPGSEQRSLGTRLAVRAGQAVEFGVTHLVQAAINGNRPLSLRFHSPMNIGSQGWVNYGSREGASAVRPQLRIAFAPTGGPDSAGQGPEDVRPGEEEAAPSPAPLEEDEGAGIAAPESTRADALTVQAVAGTTPGRDVAATVTLGWVVPGRNGLAEGKDESGVRAAVSAGCIPGGFESPGDAGFEPGRSRSEARVSVADGSCLSAGSEWETLLPLLGELPPF
jgi:hypothetical protein